MHINGWQRLWLLGSVLWALAVLELAGAFQPDQAIGDVVPFMVRLWAVPVAAMYGFGLGLAWVRRGFQTESQTR